MVVLVVDEEVQVLSGHTVVSARAGARVNRAGEGERAKEEEEG